MKYSFVNNEFWSYLKYILKQIAYTAYIEFKMFVYNTRMRVRGTRQVVAGWRGWRGWRGRHPPSTCDVSYTPPATWTGMGCWFVRS